MSFSILLLFKIILLAASVSGKCAFSQSESMMPFAYDGDAFPLNYTM